MDNLAHSLVGLTAAKAGLDRLSPYATAVCLVSANAADSDFITLVFGDRWTLLQNHRGITHSILGTIILGLLIPTIAFAIEQVVEKFRRGQPRIRFRGLLIASLIVAATHPLMDWTNNYGVRPLLPWSGRWFYGDLVFIVDPYIWLMLGGIAFLLTSETRAKTIAWIMFASFVTALLLFATSRRDDDAMAAIVVRSVWFTALGILTLLRCFAVNKRIGRRAAAASLACVAIYWGTLGIVHRSAYAQAIAVASSIAASHHEQVVRTAAMPIAINPLRWQSVTETDKAIYRFAVRINSGDDFDRSDGPISRYEKPGGREAQLVSTAMQDRRAQALLSFARFPMGKSADTDCVGQTLVQFSDLRYTEPGSPRSNFSVNIPVDCLSR